MNASAGKAEGPGTLGVAEVGRGTVATTTLLSSRLLMAYAAGIGETAPAYYDDLREGGVAVHPGICFRLQWNSRFVPDSPVNRRADSYSVHAFTDLILHRPLVAGDALTTQGRLIGRCGIAPGVYSIERYSMMDGRGRPAATLDYNRITRGAKLDGPDVMPEETRKAPSAGQLADTPLWEETHHIPRHAAHLYTECAAIYNPIHTEPSHARAAGLPDIILHGSATQALAMSDIIRLCLDGDPRRVTRFLGQLRAPVLMDTQLRVQCLADETVGDERRIFFRALNQEGKPAIANGLLTGRA